MAPQSYLTHRRYPFQRYLLPAVLFTAFFFAVFFAGMQGRIGCPGACAREWLPVLMCVGMLLQWFYTRVMVNRVQDRAIRAEENHRHRVLTGKDLSPALTMRQIVALRFASDAELPALAEMAEAEKLSGESIKKKIKEWRPDYRRA
jgi:uncharacterized protein DUF6526